MGDKGKKDKGKKEQQKKAQLNPKEKRKQKKRKEKIMSVTARLPFSLRLKKGATTGWERCRGLAALRLERTASDRRAIRARLIVQGRALTGQHFSYVAIIAAT